VQKTEQENIGFLFLHALPFDGTMWSRYTDLLPGRTFTPTLYTAGNSVQSWAAEALRIATTERLIIVGCSIGGSCALEIAASAPERVDALVLIGTKADHQPDLAFQNKVIQTLEARGTEEAWEAYWAPLFCQSTDSSVIKNAERIFQNQSSTEIARGVTAFHTRPSRGHFAASWPKRTIIVSGEEDVAPGVARSIALATSMPNARCEIIGGSGHYVPLEQPAALRKILEGLISEII